MDKLAVTPDYQRKGVAIVLLNWSMDHAAEEKVPVTLVATRVGRPLYESVGFSSYGTWC